MILSLSLKYDLKLKFDSQRHITYPNIWTIWDNIHDPVRPYTAWHDPQKIYYGYGIFMVLQSYSMSMSLINLIICYFMSMILPAIYNHQNQKSSCHIYELTWSIKLSKCCWWRPLSGPVGKEWKGATFSCDFEEATLFVHFVLHLLVVTSKIHQIP